MKKNRAILLLAAYDFESLYLTLKSLEKTVDKEENIVIVLNGKRGLRSAMVEEIAREWASQNSTHRYIVKPLNYGNDALTSISEVIEKFPLFREVDYICKIDDDLIPLRKGWVDELERVYEEYEQKYTHIGFVTSLINNNSWGFNQLLDIFLKRKEYENIMNFESLSGSAVVKVGGVADGARGSVWEYPYLAKWIHKWTLCNIPEYLERTKNLGIKEVPLDTHYSIGCIFFRKELWLSMKDLKLDSNFDEFMIHQYCMKNGLRKFAVLNEPMGHLFYYVQREANYLILDDIRKSLNSYWNDESFNMPYNFDERFYLKLEMESLKNEIIENSASAVLKRKFPRVFK
ncbi:MULTISPECIES: hypothetical protein [Chitinophagaceae]